MYHQTQKKFLKDFIDLLAIKFQINPKDRIVWPLLRPTPRSVRQCIPSLARLHSQNQVLHVYPTEMSYCNCIWVSLFYPIRPHKPGLAPTAHEVTLVSLVFLFARPMLPSPHPFLVWYSVTSLYLSDSHSFLVAHVPHKTVLWADFLCDLSS